MESSFSVKFDLISIRLLLKPCDCECSNKILPPSFEILSFDHQVTVINTHPPLAVTVHRGWCVVTSSERMTRFPKNVGSRKLEMCPIDLMPSTYYCTDVCDVLNININTKKLSDFVLQMFVDNEEKGCCPEIKGDWKYKL